MAGTAVLRMVVSSDSMKNATATSHGNRRLTASGCSLVAEGGNDSPAGAMQSSLTSPKCRRRKPYPCGALRRRKFRRRVSDALPLTCDPHGATAGSVPQGDAHFKSFQQLSSHLAGCHHLAREIAPFRLRNEDRQTHRQILDTLQPQALRTKSSSSLSRSCQSSQVISLSWA